MTRLTQRQWVDVLNRSAEQAGREADVKYGLNKKKSKAPTKSKSKVAKKSAARARAAAE